MKNYSIKVKLAVPIILIAVLVLGTMTFIIARNGHQTAQKAALDKTSGAARNGANMMRFTIEDGLGVARSIAGVLISDRKSGAQNRERTEQQLKELLVGNKNLIGTWTGWEANAFDSKDASYSGTKGHDQTGRFIPYYSYEKGQPALNFLVGYEKDNADGEYYWGPKKSGKENMAEPYLYAVDGVQTLMTSAAVPMFIDGKVVGVSGVDLPLKEAQSKASTVKPFETSESFVISSTGNYVTNSDEKLITKPASFPFDEDKFKAAIAEGKELSLIGMDKDKGEEFLYVMAPIQTGTSGKPWAFVIKTPMKTVLADANSLMLMQLSIALGGIVVLLIAVMVMARMISNSVSSLSAKLQHSGDQVSSAISQLTIAGQSLSESSSSSAASLEETVAALEEMTSMVKMNSDNAKQAASLSATSSEAAVRGEKEMEELLASMNEISKSSKQIEEIINVIDDIAFQTNLLALNAAVEAARAGEQGKGFAVVAEAVRTLAQRSASAAKDITGLIKESVEKIERGTHKADQSGEVLKTIVTSVKKVSDLNNEIAAASEEQSTGIQQISKAMNQLDQSVQSNAASSEEIAGTSEEINGQAQVMKTVVDELNLVVYGEGSRPVAHTVAPTKRKSEPSHEDDEDNFFDKKTFKKAA
jgi:Methyl-accepting chemotaxis protein